VDIARVRVVVLAAGSSRRMGFDKLAAPFAGVPLARRVALALAELRPLVVATYRVADAIGDLRTQQLVVTAPTAGPSATLALAHAAVPHDLVLAVVMCDMPLLDARRVRAFVARVPDDADLAWPEVNGVPGHPVLWSPRARTRIPTLRDDETPARIRRDPALRAVALEESDDAYVTDVDTPEGWAAAEARFMPNRR
jgi:molybdenum cofactor cytidylyltransferase/nicotine blue oxidoreductase